MESIEESSTLKEVAKAALSANSEPRGKSTTFLEMTEHKIPSQVSLFITTFITTFIYSKTDAFHALSTFSNRSW